MSRRSHKPERSCMGCMRRDVKSSLIRLVARGGTVSPDYRATLPGRGGYLHPRRECLERFAASRVREFRSLKEKLNREERVAIIEAIKMRLDSKSTVA